MIHFRLFGFLIFLQPLFFLMAALFAGAATATTPEQWSHVGLFVGAAFLSLLVHHLGHAFLYRHYGAEPQIVINGLGGSCLTGRAVLTREQSSLAMGAGPLASVILALLSKAALGQFEEGTMGEHFWFLMLMVNSLWTLLNLLPVIPLDGGHLLDLFIGRKRRKITGIIGGVTASLLAVFFTTMGSFLGAVVFGAYAYENFTGKRIIG